MINLIWAVVSLHSALRPVDIALCFHRLLFIYHQDLVESLYGVVRALELLKHMVNYPNSYYRIGVPFIGSLTMPWGCCHGLFYEVSGLQLLPTYVFSYMYKVMSLFPQLNRIKVRTIQIVYLYPNGCILLSRKLQA